MDKKTRIKYRVYAAIHIVNLIIYAVDNRAIMLVGVVINASVFVIMTIMFAVSLIRKLKRRKQVASKLPEISGD